MHHALWKDGGLRVEQEYGGAWVERERGDCQDQKGSGTAGTQKEAIGRGRPCRWFCGGVREYGKAKFDEQHGQVGTVPTAIGGVEKNNDGSGGAHGGRWEREKTRVVVEDRERGERGVQRANVGSEATEH